MWDQPCREGDVTGDGSFGAWLRQRRTQVLGLTQVELAGKVFCSETMVRKIERGERQPARDLAERLVRTLGVPEDEIPGYVAWARGIAGPPSSDSSDPDPGEILLSGTGSVLRTVLVPLDAVASFGSSEPRVVRLSEPFLGRLQWAAVPLASLVPESVIPLCTGEGCNGLNAEITKCADSSITIDGDDIVDPETNEIVASVELRFSRLCQTTWARITRFSRRQFDMEAWLRDETGAILEPTRFVVSPDVVYGYGPMWYAPAGSIGVQACGKVEGLPEARTKLH
jgi:transcriptional regulator with XRE-family HTH domain